MVSQVHIIERLYNLSHSIRVIKAGQKVQIAVKLLGPMYKLPEWNPVGLFKSIADVELLCLSYVNIQNAISK